MKGKGMPQAGINNDSETWFEVMAGFMSEEWIYEHITRLHTPVGYYTVTDGEKEIPFSVEKNGFDLPYHIYDEAENICIIQTKNPTFYKIEFQLFTM